MIEVGSDVGNGFRHVFADVRKVALALNRLDEGEQFVANALAIKLVEVAFIVAWVLSAHLEIVGFPPRCRHVDVAFCARNNEFALRFYALSDLQRCHCVGINERYFSESIEVWRIVDKVCADGFVGIVGSQ